MAVNLSPVGGVAAQFFTNSGAPLTGGKIFTYLAGTTTPATTYTTSQGNVQWTNPIVLNAAGRVPSGGEIWLTDGILYKFVLKDADDVTIATYDNITGINSNFVNYTNQQELQTATAGQTVFTLTTMTYQPGTNSLSVFVDGVNQYGPGAQYAYTETSSTVVTFVSGLHVGAEVKFTTSQINASSYGVASQIGFTGFKGQTGNVQDLAGNDGSDWIGFEADGTGAVAISAQDKMRQIVSVTDFGAVGDGVTVCTTEIQAALDAASANSAILLFPTGTFLIDDPLIVKSNTTIIMSGVVKVDSMPLGGYEAVFVTDPSTPANNIEFISPKIDGNSIVPTNGIMLRYGATNIRVQGGYIRNCANNSGTPGGRAFNIEGGVDQQNITISGTTITDCWNGVSFVGGATQANSNVSISNLAISDCQIAISLFGNTSGYPHTGEFMQAVFSNISIRNCGHLTTFTTQAGVICSDRGSNVSFSNIYVFNDSTYGAVGSLWRGDANNISMSNVTMDGDLTAALFDFSSYAESNSYPLAVNSSLDSRFLNVKHIGTIPEIIVLPVSTAAYLTNCQFDVITDVVTSDSPINTNLNNKTDVYIKAQNKTENSILQGYCSDIYLFDNLFSNWNGEEQNFSLFGAARAWALINGTTGAVNRGFGLTCTRNGSGDYSIAITRPLPTVNYVVVVDAEPANNNQVQSNVVSTKTGSGFNLSTYSNNVLTDKSLINIVVYY